MDLHPLAHGFADVAEDYERGRPGYSPATVEAIRAALDLPAGARVADVGAGTGKLTRALAAAGIDVVAVEPLPGLRERLRTAVPGVEVAEGLAEALPLADGSVRAVTCADSFHWFDGPAAVAEFARVIEPGGGLALLWNAPAGDGAPQPWQAELGALLDAIRPEHPGFSADQGRGAVEASPAFGPLQRTDVVHEHHTDRARLVAALASMSYVGAMPAAERHAFLAQADALLARHGVTDATAPLRTTVWTARRLSPAPNAR